MSELKVLVIGGVACGPKAASRLKRLMPEAKVTMIEKNSLVSYGACGLPYYVGDEFKNIQALIQTTAGVPRTPEYFATWKGIDTRIGTEAVSIDRQNKTVRVRTLASGVKEDLPYDKLVLATGGSAFRPPIDGLDLENVWFMTHPDDAGAVKKAIKEKNLKKAVLVGAGFIGLEMAEALTNAGLDVTLVEMAAHIMPGVLDEDTALQGQLHLQDQDVELVMGETVMALEGENGRVSAVATDKQKIAADVVIVGVGTRPNDQLARAAGLECDKGICINKHCQTSDPDIYAGGDCVRNPFMHPVIDEPLYVPLGSTANKHGRLIANHIAGKPTPFGGILCSTVARVFDYTLGRTGLTEQMARKQGLDIAVTTWSGFDKPHYMPGAHFLSIKMIVDRNDRKLLGVQVAGAGDASKRLDVAATAIYFGGTLEDLINLDFGYAPPFGPPLDPLAVCAHLMLNKLDGMAVSVNSLEAKRMLDEDNPILLDVRLEDEAKMEWISHTDIVKIPLAELRDRVDELPRDRPVLTYCKVSMRGYEAQLILNAAGFEKVCFIEGGIVAWPFATAMPGL